MLSAEPLIKRLFKTFPSYTQFNPFRVVRQSFSAGAHAVDTVLRANINSLPLILLPRGRRGLSPKC
jgi:hypothetical protein